MSRASPSATSARGRIAGAKLPRSTMPALGHSEQIEGQNRHAQQDHQRTPDFATAPVAIRQRNASDDQRYSCGHIVNISKHGARQALSGMPRRVRRLGHHR